MELITSLQNPKIKLLKRLEKAAERKENNLILIEGQREVCLALDAGFEVPSIFVCEELWMPDERYNLKAKNRDKCQMYSITKDVFESLAYREGSDGIVATAVPKQLQLNELILSDSPLILIIEAVEKPGNLGAMLRTCDAAKVDAVIICDPKTDLYNPNVIRSSIGTVFTNQLVAAATDEVLIFLQEKAIQVVAAELNATQYHYEQNFQLPTAIVVGTEATGLSNKWLNAANVHVKIPMLGQIDSLNVSVSAAVLLFEAVRQRR